VLNPNDNGLNNRINNDNSADFSFAAFISIELFGTPCTRGSQTRENIFVFNWNKHSKNKQTLTFPSNIIELVYIYTNI